METSNYISADPTVLKRTKKENSMVSPSLTLCYYYVSVVLIK